MIFSALLRGESGLRPLTSSLRLWGVWAAFVALSAAPVLASENDAPRTPAGTRIVNVATVEFRTATGQTGSAAASADFIVGQVAGVDIEPPLTSTALPGAEVVFPHTLHNIGNGSDAFTVQAVTPRGWPVRMFHDVDGDGRLSAADTLLVGSLSLEMDASFPLLVVVNVPQAFVRGTSESVRVTAESSFNGNVSDELSDAIQSADPELTIAVDKKVDLLEASEGSLLTYAISVLVTGSGQRAGVTLVDTVPTTATYEPGTLRLNGVLLTDIGDDDQGSVDLTRGIVAVDLSAIVDGQPANVSFQTRINVPSAVGTQVVNRASLNVATPLGNLRGESQNAVTRVATPALQITKTLNGPEAASIGDSLTYTIQVRNPSTTLSASGVEVIDTLPQYLSLRRSTPAAEQSGNVLRWLIPSLGPGALVRIDLVVEVGDVTDSVRVVNRAHLRRNGMADGEAVSGPVTLSEGDTASLALDLEAEVLQVQIGSTLPLRVHVSNDGSTTVTDILVRVVIPSATRFISQTLQGSFSSLVAVPGAPQALGSGGSTIARVSAGGSALEARSIQLDSFSFRADTLTVRVPGELQPTESFSFRYLLTVGNGAKGVLLNQATAEGRRGSILATARGRVVASNRDDVPVILERNRPLETRTVIGKVFIDGNGNGVQEQDEPGIPAIDVWTEDGEMSSTDEYGKFSFVSLRAGSHAFRLDPASLPMDLRIAGSGPERGMRVVETNGWTSGRVVFPLTPRRARVADALIPAGASGASCAALKTLIGGDSLTCSTGVGEVPADVAAAVALATSQADDPLAPMTLVWLETDPAGWPEVAFLIPAGWSVVPGTATLAGKQTEPEVRTAANGENWLVWNNLPSTRADLSLYLWEGTGIAFDSKLVTVAPLRSVEDREGDKGTAFITGPSVSVFAPADGFVSRTNRLYLGARGEPGRPVAVFLGDSLVTETTFRPDGVQDFIGLELPAGPQTFRVRMTNSFGNQVWDSVRVHRSGAPAEFRPEHEPVSVTADGRTPARTRVRVFDRWGVPVVNSPLVTLRMVAGRFVGKDEDPSSIGHQVRTDADGWANVELIGGRETGAALLLVSAGDVHAEVQLELLPAIRPLILTGLGQVSIGSGGQNFGAVTARGRLDERTSLTLSYDSRRLDQGRDVFGNNSDPLEDGRYSIIGDASQQRSLSASRYNFAASIERGMDWLKFGDVRTTDFSQGMELSRYGRSLPGTVARVTTGGVVWNAFGASTTQSLKQVQIRGSGTSGPFALDGSILPGTEQVRVEIRAAENPTRAMSEQLLTRYLDYQIDYDFGTLLLKQALPSADAFGNPVFLVLTYEAESGGDRTAVFGVRASSDLNGLAGEHVDSVPFSVSVIRDGQPGQEFSMGAFQAGIVQKNGARLVAEIAVAESGDSSDVATRIEGKLPLFAGRMSLGGHWTRVGDDFRNPANIALQAGAEELHAAADLRFGSAQLTLAHERQQFAQRGIERSRTTIGFTQAIRSNLNLEARFAGDGSASTGLASSSGAGEYKLTWQAAERLKVFAEARDQFWADGGIASPGSRVGGGASVDLARLVSLEARHTRVTPTGSASPYNVSSLGVTSQVRSGTRAWSTYQLMGGADGRANTAVVGLNHQFVVGSDWRFLTMAERRSGVSGAAPGDPILASPFERPEEDYLAGSLGMEFAPQGKSYRVSLRGEAKDGTRLSSQIGTLAGDVSFNGALALLSRQEFVQQSQLVGTDDRRMDSRSSLWGLAFRPTSSDKLNVLFKLHYKDGTNPTRVGVLARDGEEQRLIGAIEGIWAPTARLEVAARFAARNTQSDATEIGGIKQQLRSQTQFLGAHGLMNVSDYLGLKVEARGMLTASSAGGVWDVAPSLLFRPFNGIEIETGYRFGNLQDPDFAVKAGTGFFMSFGARITEQTLPTAADFWRTRFGR